MCGRTGAASGLTPFFSCAFPLRGRFGFPGERATHCSEHRLPGMCDVKDRKCAHPGCGKQPSYAAAGQRPKYCSEHRTEHMVNVSGEHTYTVPCRGRS
jgi:hypothetical protein